ncbi:hypothetical protein GCM10009830_39060 [Glycomyces endophyticus]|uniref:Uncharacterized protein n=1 Tax=Glycomyces endophyticus TaxID=480996 RepID=A0ABN2HGR3_9ACTN
MAAVGGEDLGDGDGVDGEVPAVAHDPGHAHRGVLAPLEPECESVTAPSELFGHDAPCLGGGIGLPGSGSLISISLGTLARSDIDFKSRLEIVIKIRYGRASDLRIDPCQ